MPGIFGSVGRKARRFGCKIKVRVGRKIDKLSPSRRRSLDKNDKRVLLASPVPSVYGSSPMGQPSSSYINSEAGLLSSRSVRHSVNIELPTMPTDLSANYGYGNSAV